MTIYPPGFLIANRYEVIQAPDIGKRILVGGMGLVYICHDTQIGRDVALKTFRPEYLSKRATRDRFLREGTAWVELGSHPHIVRCYDVKYIDPTVFLILERIVEEQGMKDASLRAWMGAPIPLDQALLFALQIARGMQHAVEKIPGLVHRDLKPENVLIGADKLPGTNINRLRVTDFGLAAILKDESGSMMMDEEGPAALGRTHLTHGIVGTPLYMAPEQWKGKPVGEYTDIYALGCILYELLAGQPAVNGLNLNELKAAHCSGKFRPLPGGLPGSIHAFLNRCLAVTTRQRYQVWNEVTVALEGLYAGLGRGPVPQEGESNADRQSVASSYNEIGASYAQIGKTQVALDYFEKALAIFHELGDRGGEGASLRNLGNAYFTLGDAKRALGCYEQYLEIARETGNRRWEGNALGNIGEVYRNQGEVHRAISCYEQYLEIAREISHRRGEGNALGSLGLAYATLGEIPRAIGCYEQYLEIAREIGDRRGEGNALGNLGNAHAALGDTHRAISHYKQYLKIAQEIGDRAGEGIALGNLGNVYLTLGEVRRAIHYYELRLEIAHEIGDRRGESNILGNLGTAYAQLREVDNALRYYQQRLDIARKIDDKEGLCATLFNMGNLYIQNEQVQEAISVWVNMYVLAKQMNLAKALQKLANVAPKVGLPEGLDGWEMLAQNMQK